MWSKCSDNFCPFHSEIPHSLHSFNISFSFIIRFLIPALLVILFIFNTLINLPMYLGWDSNPHGHFWPTDFKSVEAAFTPPRQGWLLTQPLLLSSWAYRALLHHRLQVQPYVLQALLDGSSSGLRAGLV